MQQYQGSNLRLFIILKVGNGTKRFELCRIERFEARGKVSTLWHANGKDSIIVNHSLTELEARLEHTHFVRCHNSHIVNLAFFDTYYRAGGGYIEMATGKTISISRTYKEYFLLRLDDKPAESPTFSCMPS